MTTIHSNYTFHARQRMSQRRINEQTVDLVIQYGRESMVRNSVIYFVGKKEVSRYRKHIDLRGC